MCPRVIQLYGHTVLLYYYMSLLLVCSKHSRVHVVVNVLPGLQLHVCIAYMRSVLMEFVLISRPLPRFPAQDNGSAGQEYHRPTVDDFLSEDAQFV